MLTGMIRRLTVFFWRKQEAKTLERAKRKALEMALLDRQKRKYVVVKGVRGNFIVARKQDIDNKAWVAAHFKNMRPKDVKRWVVFSS